MNPAAQSGFIFFVVQSFLSVWSDEENKQPNLTSWAITLYPWLP
jgi:hypothetical protein